MSESLSYWAAQFPLFNRFCLIRSSTPSCRAFWTATLSGRALTCRWLARVLGSWVAVDCRSLVRSSTLWRFWPRPGDCCRTVSSTQRFLHSSLATSSTSSMHHSSTHSWREVPVHECPHRVCLLAGSQKSMQAYNHWRVDTFKLTHSPTFSCW